MQKAEKNPVELLTLMRAVVNGEDEIVKETVRTALGNGYPASQILSDALIPAMAEVGRLFEAQEFYLPEILIAADAMKQGVAILRPLLGDAGERSCGSVALGSVEGDVHDIGKNLVSMMLEASGFRVTDLGVDVAPQAFVQAVLDGAQVIGISAMLPTTMLNIKVVIEAVKAAGIRERVKILVGGAILTPEYAAAAGADGYVSDANVAVRKIKELLSRSHTPAPEKTVQTPKSLSQATSRAADPVWSAFSNADIIAR